MTPEGKIKALVKACLHAYRVAPAGKEPEYKGDVNGWYFLPVSNGMGVGGIHDFIGCYKGLFFTIETKAQGKKMTERQLASKYGIERARGRVFLIDGDTTELENWFRIEHHG